MKTVASAVHTEKKNEVLNNYEYVITSNKVINIILRSILNK